MFDFRETVNKILEEQILNKDGQPVSSTNPSNQNTVSLKTILTPKTEQEDFNTFDQVIEFAKKLYKTGDRRFTKDTLLTYKSIWPYADVVDYIRSKLSDAKIVQGAPDEQFNKLKEVLNKPEVTNGSKLIAGFYDNNQAPVDIISSKIDMNIDDKITYLTKNVNNYLNYFNLRLRQASNETQAIAAEPYLNLSPLDSVIKVLKDFGGYDETLAANILKYPAENKYTQIPEESHAGIMRGVVDISKLILTFYREWVQLYAGKILDMLNYADPYTSTVSRNMMINQEQLLRAVRQGAGTLQQTEWQKIKKNIIDTFFSQGVQTTGKEQAPGNILQKLIHDDYLKFIEGKSILILPPKEYDNFQATQFTPLVKTVSDFNGQPGKGQLIYEQYLDLFNNMRKGSLMTKSGDDPFSRLMGSIWKMSGHSLYGGPS